MEERNYDHQDSMRALKCLALEIQDMDEAERLKTLEWIMRLETEGKGNRFWLLVAKCLLVEPELVPKVLNLVERELNTSSNIRYPQITPQRIVQATAASLLAIVAIIIMFLLDLLEFEGTISAITVIITIGFAVYFYLDAKKKDRNVADVIERTEEILKQKHA